MKIRNNHHIAAFYSFKTLQRPNLNNKVPFSENWTTPKLNELKGVVSMSRVYDMNKIYDENEACGYLRPAVTIVYYSFTLFVPKFTHRYIEMIKIFSHIHTQTYSNSEPIKFFDRIKSITHLIWPSSFCPRFIWCNWARIYAWIIYDTLKWNVLPILN